LRLTHFKTSNGPNVHVILIAATDAQDDENFLKKNIERVDLGSLKGNEGDHNYTIPAGANLSKYRAVSIYCERFNVNFGAARPALSHSPSALYKAIVLRSIAVLLAASSRSA
jgi:hypothetical protein